MKKWLLAIIAASALISTQAHAIMITSKAGIMVDGSMFHDRDSGFEGTIEFGVFGPVAPPPAFDQVASWSMGVEAGGSLYIEDTDTDPLSARVIIDDSNDEAIVFDLGSFAMVDQFTPGSGITDYDDVFSVFAATLMTASPTLEDVFLAVEAITVENLFTLAEGLVGSELAGLLGLIAPQLTFSDFQFDGTSGSVFVSSGVIMVPDMTGGMDNLGSLDVQFSGTAFLEAQYVNAPASAALLVLALAGIMLRRRS
uniref:hypothetical protein n=1 Tax=Ningiella ruwaisensis TaxID=2364274 RepID=UPI00109F7B66|nr:hypothetical protein [Ningiella ruwaisensis]